MFVEFRPPHGIAVELEEDVCQGFRLSDGLGDQFSMLCADLRCICLCIECASIKLSWRKTALLGCTCSPEHCLMALQLFTWDASVGRKTPVCWLGL